MEREHAHRQAILSLLAKYQDPITAAPRSQDIRRIWQS